MASSYQFLHFRGCAFMTMCESRAKRGERGRNANFTMQAGGCRHTISLSSLLGTGTLSLPPTRKATGIDPVFVEGGGKRWKEEREGNWIPDAA